MYGCSVPFRLSLELVRQECEIPNKKETAFRERKIERGAVKGPGNTGRKGFAML